MTANQARASVDHFRLGLLFAVGSAFAFGSSGPFAKALMAGKDHVVSHSLKNKLQASSAKVLPETVTAELHRKQTEPKPARE